MVKNENSVLVIKRKNLLNPFYSLRVSYVSLSEELQKVPHQKSALRLPAQPPISYSTSGSLFNSTDLIFLICEMRAMNKATLRFLSALTIHGS